MVLESILNALGIDAAKGGLKETLRALKTKFSGKKYKTLLSTALRELLTVNPDISQAEACILAAEATGVQPSRELLHAKEILHKVKRHQTKKKPAKKKTAKKALKARCSIKGKKTSVGKKSKKSKASRKR